jgi:hypothetical protein
LRQTVWPGSTWRASTTPETGERITARSRLVIADDSCACEATTLALAEFTTRPAARDVGFGRLELGQRGHLAARQAVDLLQPVELRRVDAESGARLRDLRPCGVEIGPALLDLVVDHVGVDLREDLPARDAIVDVGEHAVDAARDFRADVDLVGRTQVAGRSHLDVERTLGHRLGDVLRLPVVGAGEVVQGAERHDQSRHPELGPAAPARLGGRAEKLVDRQGGRVVHELILSLTGSG